MQSLHEISVRREAPTASDTTSLWPFVSQFVLGPAHATHLPHWQRFRVSDRLVLSVHPALACTQLRDGARELTLLGHLLDPLRPEASNIDCLRALLACDTRAALLEASAHYGGRWALIAGIGDETFLFHDALGLRRVFYTDRARTGDVWVMSQPGIALDLLPLTPDPQAVAYTDTQTFRCTHEYRWPGAASPFQELRHLLPNHWLDLDTGRARRYWPTAALEPLGVEAAVERLMALLPGLMQAAASRFDAVVSLTAGVDSRVVLAAARAVVDRTRVMSLRQGRQPDRHPDIEIPARLLARLGIPHDIVRAPATMSPAFAFRFKHNAYQAHDHYGHDAEALLERYGRAYAVITGSGAEIARQPFHEKLPHADRMRLTPETLAWLEYGSVHPFLVAHFADWLQGAEQSYVRPIDLFEWEQGATWLAMVQLEFDIAWREIVTPYNCRTVLTTMLGVPARYRSARDSRLCRTFIARAWPELLHEPINPHKYAGRLRATWSDIKAARKYWLFRRGLKAERVTHPAA